MDLSLHSRVGGRFARKKTTGRSMNHWDGSTDWSEGSVFAMLGIAMNDEELQLEGFKLIYHEGHRISPILKEVMYQELIEADVIPDAKRM